MSEDHVLNALTGQGLHCVGIRPKQHFTLHRHYSVTLALQPVPAWCGDLFRRHRLQPETFPRQPFQVMNKECLHGDSVLMSLRH